MALRRPPRRVQPAPRIPLAGQLQFLSSAWAIPAATSSPFGRDSTAARFALPRPGTSLQFFAGAPAPCSEANTARKSLSARSNLRALAIAGPLRCREQAPKVLAPHERAHCDPVSVCPISSAGWQCVSPALHPPCRAAIPAAPDCDGRTHRCPPAAREIPPPALRFPRSGTNQTPYTALL